MKKNCHIFLSFIALFMVVSFSYAKDTRSLEELTKATDRGEAKAQYNLGLMYDFGRGVPQDDAKAKEWYEKAAAQDYAEAQYNLGVMYADGQGVPQDDAKAAEWFEKAAAQGHAKAQYNLGLMYYFGVGVSEDYAKAKELLAQACKNNVQPACMVYGLLNAKKNDECSVFNA